MVILCVIKFDKISRQRNSEAGVRTTLTVKKDILNKHKHLIMYRVIICPACKTCVCVCVCVCE